MSTVDPVGTAPDAAPAPPAGGAAPLLEVRNLSIRYGRKGLPAVDDVSFTIARG